MSQLPPPLPRLDQAVALYQAARPQEALDLAEQVLAQAPASGREGVDWLNLAAAACRALGQNDGAERYWRESLSLHPGSPQVRHRLGILLQELGRYQEAVACYRQVLELRPGFAEAYSRMGVALRELKLYAAAEASYRQALDLCPDYPTVLTNLGALLADLQRYPEAEACYRRSLALQPEVAQTHHNLGLLLHALRRYPEAEACYRRALELRPGYVSAEWNLSVLLLQRGQFEEGWRRYEIRYHPERHGGKAAVPALPYPQWQGQPLASKSLTVWPEQGYGDAIQFCRYLPLLKRRGAARITLVCKPPLKALLEGVEGADAVVGLPEAARLPPHDYWMLLLSAPLLCGTAPDAIPAVLPYLRPPPERLAQWEPRLGALSGLRVGLVWKGSATNGNDAHRSLPGLADLAPLWSVPGVSFASLQKGQGEDQAAAPPPGQPILALGSELRDFADTAAVLDRLDLLISVDTATAHLAGALGRPCWVLLPAQGTDWRWQLERGDSPWYPGAVRLFRQAEPGDWAPVVAAAAAALRDFRPQPERIEIDRLAASIARLAAEDARLLEALIDRLLGGNPAAR
jgi:tetratricopeptide (TPR) repeat protein